MARNSNRLTARRVATLTKPGLYADGNGLYLGVGKGAARSWVYVYRRGTKRTELGLGSLRDVSLAEARMRASEYRKRVLAGENPRTGLGATGVPTFGEVADEYISTHERTWSNPKHLAQWKMTLSKYAAPLRAKRVDEISVEDVLAVLKPHWTRTPETAKRLRGRIEAVLDAAKARGLRSGENPAVWKGNLKHLLPAQPKLARGHHSAMAYKDVPNFLARLRAREGVAPRALEFAILTAARSSEVRLASWDEIDFDAEVWTVPAARMKARREHRVPLTPRTIAILEEMGRAGRVGLIFPGQRGGRPLSDASLSAVLRRMKVDVTVHGFRSSFKDWAREQTEFPNELSEAALAHVIGNKVEAAYARGDVLERRRELMKAWEEFGCADVRFTR